MKRCFLIVLDSFGIGALPDAASFGDSGANTLKTISESNEFDIPNLINLGFGNIDGVDFLPKVPQKAAVGRLAEASNGKDTTTGHWEIAGLVSKTKMPVFENGFPPEIIEKFSRLTGRGVLCNKPYSGTKVIMDYGMEHLKTGKLIVYTSADSVFQIAAHEKLVPPEKLYEYCRMARKILTGKFGVGRVIARPFKGEYPNFERTPNRHDFSLEPPQKTIFDALQGSGYKTFAVGKIWDIFAGKGIDDHVFTSSNADGMEKTLLVAKKSINGLCFVNLVDFDMLYGHRRDIKGYAAAISRFDNWLPQLLKLLNPDDILLITADHGCDPGFSGTDHTREYIPLVAFGDKIKPNNIGTRGSFSDIAATVAEYFGVDFNCSGKSFLKEIT